MKNNIDQQIKDTIKSIKGIPVNFEPIQLTPRVTFHFAWVSGTPYTLDINDRGSWGVVFNKLEAVKPDSFDFQTRLDSWPDKVKQDFLFHLEELILTNV
jgi:hypothetical protein